VLGRHLNEDGRPTPPRVDRPYSLPTLFAGVENEVTTSLRSTQTAGRRGCAVNRRREQISTSRTTTRAIVADPNFLHGLQDAWLGHPSDPPLYDPRWAYERARSYVAACRRAGRPPLRPIVDGKVNPAIIRELNRLFEAGDLL
jgi:hypothetical protein